MVNGKSYDFSVAAGEAAPATASSGTGSPVNSKMPGKIITVLVSNGQSVTEGQPLLKMEALKMEMNVSAPKSGVVSEVCVTDGQQVAVNDVLVRLA
jgi:biotin carboxyl carrier protein